MSALGRVVRSGVGRRRVQTVVIGLVVAIAVTAAVLGGTLMEKSRAPFDRAFGQQHGAHLAAQFDAATTTAEQLAATTKASGVVAASGPFRSVVVTPEPKGERGGMLRPITVVGRAEPGTVDVPTMIEGRWVTGPGEIVLHSDGRLPVFLEPKIGSTMSFAGLSGGPTLTVVGRARSVSETAGGWVVPGQVAALVQPGADTSLQMLYRFAAAGTAAQVDAGRAAVEAAVPGAKLTGSRSWLTTRTDSAGNVVLFVPFLIAFGVLGVLMAVLIIGNVIAGAVSTSTRRIGILKALGFTPRQVVRAYTVQALVPAVAGAAVGAVAGNLLVIPILAQTNRVYGTSDSGVALWVGVVVVAGALAMVAVTAWAAAGRAGRLRTVDVLAVGRTPRPRRGHTAARVAARLPLPRPVTLGLAHPFARPVRSLTIVAAIAFGAAAAMFAIGLGTTLNRVQASESHADVVIHPGRQMSVAPGGGPPPGNGPPPAPDAAKIVAAVTAQPGTAGYAGTAETDVIVAGIADPVGTLAFTGPGSSYGYEILDGTWFTGPGQIVVAKPFLTTTGTRIGDSVTLTVAGTRVEAKVVGEVFNIEDRGMQVLTDAGTLAADPELQIMEYNVTLQPGTDAVAYVESLNKALTGSGGSATVKGDDTNEVIITINTLTGLLTLMLVTVAALGVLNMVVLETRERVHDLGVHKALGMTPRQTITMVVASVTVTGLLGGVVGAPLGLLLHRAVTGEMARVTGLTLPPSVIDVYPPPALAAFVVGGLVIAVAGALLPAGWAARTRTATALRTE